MKPAALQTPPGRRGDREFEIQGDNLDRAIGRLLDSYLEDGGVNHARGPNLPSRQAVVDSLQDIQALLFPGFREEQRITENNLGYVAGELAHRAARNLVREIERSLEYKCRVEGDNGCPGAFHLEARSIVMDFFDALPGLRAGLMGDVQAAFLGDPAAKTIEEVILAYPGLEAVAVHRIAHFFWEAGIPLIPRMMSEQLHAKTGIDIHPGAVIGQRFFIDHGTGVVVGETAVIGNDVKIYQGVTLGALSVRKEEGQKKRHPTIEDEVTIYSGATILGGNTIIGRGSVIGGNVWLTKSVPAFSRVYLPQGDLARIELQYLDKGADI